MPDLTLRRERKQAYYFTEKLGDSLGLDMILIPKGRFTMGSPSDELARSESEGPQHEVTVPSFFMGRYPITQAQWRFMVTSLSAEEDVGRTRPKLNPDPSRFKGDNHPVERVSWRDAVEFCRRLSAYTGRAYRLPTEAEWEYACRAGTTTPFYFGETITTDLANYRGTDDESFGLSGSYGRGPKGEYRGKTTPVDHFGIANAFGLCDMHGNVWEWCEDHWHGDYKGAPTDGRAWLSSKESANHVIRGGSWAYNPRYCRSAYRYYFTPVNSVNSLGFRVVCSAPRT